MKPMDGQELRYLSGEKVNVVANLILRGLAVEDIKTYSVQDVLGGIICALVIFARTNDAVEDSVIEVLRSFWRSPIFRGRRGHAPRASA